jgi:hypothetical protein
VSDEPSTQPGVSPGRTAPPDRRRSPRFTTSDMNARLPMLLDVDVLDISERGAWVRSRHPLVVGDRAQIRMVLNREPFVAWVSVVRVRLGRHDGSIGAAVAFTEMNENSAQALRRLVRQ